MRGVTKIGDINSKKKIAITGSSTVFVNGKGVQRLGDTWTPKRPVTTSCSSTVFINGIGIARLGDSTSDGATIITSSTNTFTS